MIKMGHPVIARMRSNHDRYAEHLPRREVAIAAEYMRARDAGLPHGAFAIYEDRNYPYYGRVTIQWRELVLPPVVGPYVT